MVITNHLETNSFIPKQLGVYRPPSRNLQTRRSVSKTIPEPRGVRAPNIPEKLQSTNTNTHLRNLIRKVR